MDYDPVAPSDEIFNEIKQAAIEVWTENYDNKYGYVDEKVGKIMTIRNYKDNWGTFVGMFDRNNQMKLMAKLSPRAQALVTTWL